MLCPTDECTGIGFLSRSFAQETPSPASQWVWTVSYGYHEGRTPTRGYAESREAAMRHSRRVATENEADASQAYPQRPSNNMDHHRGAEFDIRLLLPACLRTLV